MHSYIHQGTALHWRVDGADTNPPLVFINSLGTDLRLWQAVVDLLAPSWRCLRFDTRGHGLSDAPAGEYSLEQLTADLLALLDHLRIDRAILVGSSLGGMMAQQLAITQPQRVAALVLANSASKMGDKQLWQQRSASVASGGLESIADAVLERWFAPDFLKSEDVRIWRNMLTRTPAAGYIGCCAALAAADFSEQLAKISAPTLAIAGSKDRAAPPETVRATAAKISGASFVEIPQVGHLPSVETPTQFTELLSNFLAQLNLSTR